MRRVVTRGKESKTEEDRDESGGYTRNGADRQTHARKEQLSLADGSPTLVVRTLAWFLAFLAVLKPRGRLTEKTTTHKKFSRLPIAGEAVSEIGGARLQLVKNSLGVADRRDVSTTFQLRLSSRARQLVEEVFCR